MTQVLSYEQGIKDTLKFLQDNTKIDMIDMPIEQFIMLLKQLRGE